MARRADPEQIDIRLSVTFPRHRKTRALRRQLFVLRVQHSQRQLAKTAQLKETRRELARVSSILGEKRRGGGEA